MFDGSAGYRADGWDSIEAFEQYILLSSDAEAVLVRGDCWQPSIHMNRWASRILLEVTGVRVERLQDISCADAIAEGIIAAANSQTIDCDTPDPRDEFRGLWDCINGRPRKDGTDFSWNANPWVWVIEFNKLGNL